MAADERIEQTASSTDQKLDMTDHRGLAELGKAFDESFGPREGTPSAPAPAKEPKAKSAPEPALKREKAAPGHHAPVEVKRATRGAEEAGEGVGLLGEPLYAAKKREQRAKLDFEDEIPVSDKKTAAFPGKDKTGGGPVKEAQAEVEETEEEEGTDEDKDPEVDAVQVKPNAHPNVKEGFRHLKTVAKARRAEIKALTQKNQALVSELETLQRNGLPPQVQQELERLRATSQRFDLLNDTQFKARYEDPIEAAGDQLVNFCVGLSNGAPELVEWAKQVKEHGFKNLSTDYWDKEIIPKVASVTNQQRVAQLAASLHARIDERNRMVSEYTATPDKINEYNTQKAIEYYSNYQREAQDESNMLVSQIGEWAQIKDLNQAATDEERALFQEHNDRCDGYKTLFEKTMGDVMHGGPRKHVRVVAQAIYGMELDRQLKETRADLEALQGEYDALKSQYNRISRARAIPGRTGGGVETKTSTNGLSTKDARSALKEYFGNQGT